MGISKIKISSVRKGFERNHSKFAGSKVYCIVSPKSDRIFYEPFFYRKIKAIYQP